MDEEPINIVDLAIATNMKESQVIEVLVTSLI